MARILRFVVALCFWQMCDGLSTKTPISKIRSAVRELERLKYQGKELEGCSKSLPDISVITFSDGQLNDPMIELTFRLALNLFKKNVTHSKWDTKVLQGVRELLDQPHTDISDPSLPTIKMVQTHFTQLEDLLSHENFSMCAWETVRQQVEMTLFRFCIHLRQRKGNPKHKFN